MVEAHHVGTAEDNKTFALEKFLPVAERATVCILTCPTKDTAAIALGAHRGNRLYRKTMPHAPATMHLEFLR